MIVIECDQGSPEWHGFRAGAITASMFAEVRRRVGGLTAQQQKYVDAIRNGKSKDEAMTDAEYKKAPTSELIKRELDGEKVGDFTEAAKNYAFRLAVERLSGQALMDDQYETYAMRRGHELEPEARELHSFQIGVEVQRTGLVLSDDNRFGASADGLIGEDGGSEYKCFVSPEKLRAILVDNDLSVVADQVQGCLWLTGRKWWHFCLYCPVLMPLGRALTIRPFDRDENYISALEADLEAFDIFVNGYVELLAQKEAA